MLIIVVIAIVYLCLGLGLLCLFFATAPHHDVEPTQEVTLRDPGWDHPANCKCRLYHN